jgi:hypothetical protein
MHALQLHRLHAAMRLKPAKGLPVDIKFLQPALSAP